jgi:3-oxoacyl-[acyl-carrier-protein] synthase-1
LSSSISDYAEIIDELTLEFPERLLRATDLPIQPKHCWVITKGHASVIYALSFAIRLICEHTIKRAVIIGIDSLVNEDAINFYMEHNRIKTRSSATGLIPGEAGAALFIESVNDAKNRGVEINNTIGAVSTAFDEHNFLSENEVKGRKLSQVMVNVLKTTNRVETAYTDLNGEALRADEWGHALLHVQSEIGYLPQKTILPAECLGDTGAASGAVSIAACLRSFSRNYAQGESILICSNSESGDIGAAIIEHSP